MRAVTLLPSQLPDMSDFAELELEGPPRRIDTHAWLEGAKTMVNAPSSVLVGLTARGARALAAVDMGAL